MAQRACGSDASGTTRVVRRCSVNGAETIDKLLQGFAADTITPDELETPFKEAARVVMTAESGQRETAFNQWLTTQPQADADAIRQAVRAAGGGAGDGATSNPPERTSGL